jgi:hypothetical protein
MFFLQKYTLVIHSGVLEGIHRIPVNHHGDLAYTL